MPKKCNVGHCRAVTEHFKSCVGTDSGQAKEHGYTDTQTLTKSIKNIKSLKNIN